MYTSHLFWTNPTSRLHAGGKYAARARVSESWSLQLPGHVAAGSCEESQKQSEDEEESRSCWKISAPQTLWQKGQHPDILPIGGCIPPQHLFICAEQWGEAQRFITKCVCYILSAWATPPSICPLIACSCYIISILLCIPPKKLSHKGSTFHLIPNSSANHTLLYEAKADFHLCKADRIVSWDDGLYPRARTKGRFRLSERTWAVGWNFPLGTGPLVGDI